jgi:TPR repeat protein
MHWLVIFLMLCAGCSRQPITSARKAQKQASDSIDSIEGLRQLAEGGKAASQRELAGRLLLGQGVNADPAAAVIWARKAALNGDETASLWMGRAALNEPDGRIEAAAWFLIGKTGGNAAIRQDAAGEIEALGLTGEELALAETRMAELKQTILTNSK